MSELVKKLEKYLEDKWDENLYQSYDPHYKDGFTDCLELLKGVIEACEKISRQNKAWKDRGHFCDSKNTMESIVSISIAALEKLNKDLE